MRQSRNRSNGNGRATYLSSHDTWFLINTPGLLMPTWQPRMCTCKDSGLKVLLHCLHEDPPICDLFPSFSSQGLDPIHIPFVISMVEHLGAKTLTFGGDTWIFFFKEINFYKFLRLMLIGT